MAEAEANAVSLKLPSFWTAHPEVWLTQAEAQFNIRGITADATKYYYVIAALDQGTACRLLAVIQTPPDSDKYTHLKQQLLNTFGLTRRERAAKLLDLSGLGDRKPSALLAEMRALAGGHTSCLLFEELFLRQLPDEIRLQMAQESFENLDEISNRADALGQAKNQCMMTEAMHKVFKKTVLTPKPTDNYTTTNQVPRDYCSYHAKFGNKAKKCQAPCSFSGNNQASRQ